MNIGFGLDNAARAWDNGGIRWPRSAVNARGLADYEGVDVSSMPRIVPEDDTSTLESLDWDLVCELAIHPPSAPPHAEYAVWLKGKLCGCPPLRDFIRACGTCWESRQMRLFVCLQCGSHRTLAEAAARVERI